MTPLHVDILSTLGTAFVGEAAFDRASSCLNPWSMCEVLRVNAEGLVAQTGSVPKGDPEGLFVKSLSIARRQGALAWELRTATSLAGYWQQAGKRAEAYRLLSEVYGRFTEGFGMRDLVAAQSLLRDLSRKRHLAGGTGDRGAAVRSSRPSSGRRKGPQVAS